MPKIWPGPAWLTPAKQHICRSLKPGPSRPSARQSSAFEVRTVPIHGDSTTWECEWCWVDHQLTLTLVWSLLTAVLASSYERTPTSMRSRRV